MTFQQFLLILRARWLVALGVLGVVVATTLVVSLLIPKQYSAETALVIDAKSSDPIMGAMLPPQMMAGYMATQADIINSSRVAERVVTLLKLDGLPAIREQWQAETGGQGALQVWVGELLQKKLVVRPSRESNVISIVFSGADPEFAAAVANAFARAYIEVNLELKVEPARQYAQWFDERSGPLREKVEAAQKRLSDYQIQHGIVTTDGRIDVESARLGEISTQLVAAEAQRMDSRSRQSQTGSADTLPEVLQSGLIQGLKAELARQEASREQLVSRVGKNHPDYARIEAEIKSLRERIVGETQRVASSIGTANRTNVAREGELRVALEAQKKRVLELRERRDQIAVLQRDVESAQRAHDLVAQRLSQTSLESQTQQTNIAVLTPATAPLKHSSPRITLNLALAMFLGTLLGAGTALLLELVDQRIRGPQDLDQLADAPLLGIIPASA
ncbi:chain length determinant protein EpsF [Aromatoleum diolicum]|uniref:Chain length determinant protein EpsF n=1 Tax=Aromatoleum diolicum TaxID=75796 RepID=A0ABX1QDZ7_9RHOO|nr:chain length determinant protein EpsF [Aromatoleum diolicum]NMG76657.1 chain length determinant protein EpsF [Aromatoleum diolicum]